MQIEITVSTKYVQGLTGYGYYAVDNVIVLNSLAELMTFAVSYSELTEVEYFQDVARNETVDGSKLKLTLENDST